MIGPHRGDGLPFSPEFFSKELSMVNKALFVTLEAKPGKEKEVEQFLFGGLPLVQEEPAKSFTVAEVNADVFGSRPRPWISMLMPIANRRVV
jgi:hypothetical protein